MARSLSWIESSELTDLFRNIGSERTESNAGLGDFAARLSNSRSAARARQPVSPPPPPAATRPAVATPTERSAERPVRPAPAARRAAMRTDRRSIVAAPPPAAVPPAPTPASRPTPPVPAPSPPATASAAPVAAPTVVPFSPTAGATLATRLDEYLGWVVDALRLDGVAVADADGLVVAAYSLGESDAIVTTSIEPMLRHIRDLFEYDGRADDSPGHRTGTVDRDDSMIHLDGFLALRFGPRHVGAVWTETNFGRFYGLLSLRDTTASEVLEHASDGFRALFAD